MPCAALARLENPRLDALAQNLPFKLRLARAEEMLQAWQIVLPAPSTLEELILISAQEIPARSQ